MRVLFFGSRSLAWRHLVVFRALALHAVLENPPDLDLDLLKRLMAGDLGPWPQIAEPEPLVLLHSDAMPSATTPGAIGAAKIAELACMERWPERRTVRRGPLRQLPAPHRSYCVHTDVDSSEESIDVVAMLKEEQLPFCYVRVKASGEPVAVELR